MADRDRTSVVVGKDKTTAEIYTLPLGMNPTSFATHAGKPTEVQIFLKGGNSIFPRNIGKGFMDLVQCTVIMESADKYTLGLPNEVKATDTKVNILCQVMHKYGTVLCPEKFGHSDIGNSLAMFGADDDSNIDKSAKTVNIQESSFTGQPEDLDNVTQAILKACGENFPTEFDHTIVRVSFGDMETYLKIFKSSYGYFCGIVSSSDYYYASFSVVESNLQQAISGVTEELIKDMGSFSIGDETTGILY